ncbi:MAG: hypothetical protein Q4P18_04810 [Methanobrevibacter sp.]|uniref:hypothetical protein n=1 Tax=Methanobrevibacter sp. TaxID=66852 RepID=UPI0026E08182|nr:hypothetical protein [Methanobrevibacter sp.]MDO5848832.1 hypothetical protein [Methanobrevibacter sp.]
MLKREIRTVEVYTETTLSSEDNSKKEVVQKKVNLLEDDPFENDDEVIVLSLEEYEKLAKCNCSEEIKQKDGQIEELTEQVKTLKDSFFDDVFDLKDQLNDKEKLIQANDKIAELNDKLNKIDEERVAIFKELDYKNKMILAYNVELNKSILKAINVVIDEARENINAKNQMLAKRLEQSIENSKKEVNEKNKAIAFEINSTMDAINEEIRNTSMIKMLLNKKNINLVVPTDDLLKPFEFDMDLDHLFDGQILELDAAEVLKEVMPKLPEPFSKYIDTLEEDNEEDINTIDIEIID